MSNQMIVCPSCGSARSSLILSCQYCRQAREQRIILQSRGVIPFPDGRWAGTGDSPTPPPKRRGRTAGVDKIGEAITVLTSRLKDGLSVSLPEIAKQVRCTPKNLQNSNRFLDAHKTLLAGMARVVRARGAKTGGSLEAYVDPREDAEEDF